MGNCFDAYWGNKQFKKLDKDRTRVGQQFAAIVGEHEKAIEVNESRRVQLQIKQTRLVQKMQSKRNTTGPIIPTRAEQQEIKLLTREMATVERRLATAHAERASVTRTHDHVTTAMTHLATNKVKQRVYAQMSRTTGMNVDDMEKDRDKITEADENLSEIVGVMHGRSVEEAGMDDESEFMEEINGDFMAALNGERTHHFPVRDTSMGLDEVVSPVPSRTGNDPGPPASASASLFVVDDSIRSNGQLHQESDDELLIS